MAFQLITLRNVPEDEANEIRALLTENSINFYETPAGNWGVSSPAIWLTEPENINKAIDILADYQNARALKIRNEYAESKARGENRTLMSELKNNPLRSLSYLIIASLILFFSVKPFLDLGR